jgi:hypothetical protein
MKDSEGIVPAPRKLTRNNATEFQIDESTGEVYPSNDGRDDPRYEYENFETNRGTIRVALREKK